MKKPDLSSEIITINKSEMRIKQKKMLFTEQETEAALLLIHLNNTPHTCPVTQLSMKIVPKSSKFLQVGEFYDNDFDENNNQSINTRNIRKRKGDGFASCSSSITFDLDDNCDEDAGEEAVDYVNKINKFRSISDLYNVTNPL